jgi:hypothetical protein
MTRVQIAGLSYEDSAAMGANYDPRSIFQEEDITKVIIIIFMML